MLRRQIDNQESLVNELRTKEDAFVARETELSA